MQASVGCEGMSAFILCMYDISLHKNRTCTDIIWQIFVCQESFMLLSSYKLTSNRRWIKENTISLY